MPSRRIAVLTGGGDAPGLNAVIRAVVKTAIGRHGWEVLGVMDGLDGFLAPDGVVPLTLDSVRGILPRGGTILGAASRGNPFVRKAVRDGREIVEDATEAMLAAIRSRALDALICIGGDGTLKIAQQLHERGVPVVGVPKTIDNDMGGTDQTFGFDTALTTATEAIDKLHTTAESHHRVMVLEVMGRHAGWIALHAGVAGGADAILIPEIPFQWDALVEALRRRHRQGATFSIVVVAEGAFPAGGQAVVSRPADALHVARLGGIGLAVADRLAETTRLETRCTVLGHLQRGGSPTPFDRILATRYGTGAIRLVAEGRFGHMSALNGLEIVGVPLAKALAAPKRVDPRGGIAVTARVLGISFGDGG